MFFNLDVSNSLSASDTFFEISRDNRATPLLIRGDSWSLLILFHSKYNAGCL